MNIDFETYSEAGYIWSEQAQRWRGVMPTKSGIQAVGAVAYSEHPSTEVICMAHDNNLWVPGLPNPTDLFEYIAQGGILSASNSMFEYLIWNNVCVRRYGWPPLDHNQLTDSLAAARHWSIPHSLDGAAKYTGCKTLKIEDGKRLIRKFSIPRNPTKNDSRKRITVYDAPEDGQKFFEYCLGDVITECELSSKIPPLSAEEHKLWLIDQTINIRGVAVDVGALEAFHGIIERYLDGKKREISEITNGAVKSPNEVSNIINFLNAHGVHTASIDKAATADLLKSDLPDTVRKVLEIRELTGASSIKKIKSMLRMVSNDGRLRGLFQYCGADKTDRWAGRGPQPQNLPNSGPDVWYCGACESYLEGEGHLSCPWCQETELEKQKWSVDAVESVIETSLEYAEDFNTFFTDTLAVISGCLRGMFTSAPGKDLICSDYSAIEAVVLAALAGEQWRLDVFRTHGKIYEMSASKITGVPFKKFLEHKLTTGEHHPLRKSIGKVAELASGYQGFVGAWKRFGALKHFNSDEEIKEAVLKWRKENSAIVKYWYDTENTAIKAIQYPNYIFENRGIKFQVRRNVLYIRLLSGRELKLHQPRVDMKRDMYGRDRLQITYMGNNKDRTKGPYGWTRLETYGGSLVESITQSTARDILAHAIVNLEAKGYPVVLHVHDEVVCELNEKFGSIKELEKIMATLPDWCKDWPIKAAGGWRGKRYRKD